MLENLTNQRFGKLVVLEKADAKANKSYKWRCKCDCGKEVIIKQTALKDGIVKSCGCEWKNKSLVGEKFYRLTVKSIDLINNKTFATCLCDCGNIVVKMPSLIKKGHIKSCGCYEKEQSKKGNPTHGLYYTRVHKIYMGMKNRCYCKTDYHYKQWGGRGIKICDEWLGENGFVNFYKWSMENGYKDTLTIDRIDNNGDYSPENCRWATLEEQQNNTRYNLILTYNGEKLTLSQASRKLNLSTSTIWHRVKKYGTNLDIALQKPIKHELSRYKNKESGN